MTVSDLRVLVDNLDEYIHIPGGIDRLKKSVLHLAVSGQLVPQDPSEGTGEELYEQIQAVKTKNKKPLPEVTDTPFEIPDSWKWVQLGNLLMIERGGSPRPIQEYLTSDPNGLNWIKIGDSDIGGRYITKTAEKIKPSGLKKTRQVYAGDLILSNSMSFGRPYILKINGCIHDGWLLLRDESDKLHKEFLYYLLFSDLCKKQFKDKTSGAVVQNLNSDKVRAVLVPLMPEAEQRRIVEKVDEIFDLIDELATKYKDEELERTKLVKSSLRALSHGKSRLALNNLQIIKTKSDASELRKAILHLATSGQLVPQIGSEGTGEELFRKLRLNNLSKTKQSEISSKDAPFDIPNTWRWVSLSDVGQIVGGGTPPSGNLQYYTDDHETGIAWLTPADLRGYKDLYISHGAKSITEAGLKNSSARLMPKGTVLFSSRAPIGHIAIAENELSTNQGFKSIVPYDSMNFLYIYRWLQYYGPIIDANASGTTFREVSGAIVSKQPIPLPPVAEQERIVQKATELLDLVGELEKHL